MAQIAQRSCGVTFWDIQSLSGQVPAQLNQPWEGWSRGILLQPKLLGDPVVILKNGDICSQCLKKKKKIKGIHVILALFGLFPSVGHLERITFSSLHLHLLSLAAPH